MKRNRRWFISLALAVLMMTGSLPEMSLPVEAETPVETGETETGEPKTGNVLSVALGTGEELNLQISGEGIPTGELHLVSNDPQAALEMYEAGSNHKADLGFLAELTDSQDQPVTLKADGKLTVTVRGTKTGEYTAPVFLLWNGETLTPVNVQKTEQGDYTFETDEIRALLILQDNGEVPAAESTETEKTEETENDVILGPQSADGVTVTVHAPQRTLPENAALTVSPYDSEKAKELTGSETVYAAADISFTSDGAPCVPSQDVTVVIEAESLKNAITPKLYHIKDDKAEEAAIASFNAEKGSLEFKARDFSPYVIADTGAPMLAAPNASPAFDYVYEIGWDDKESETKKYLDEEHTSLLIKPSNNALQSATLNVSLDLKGDKTVEFPAGSITMAFPATYFEGWNEEDPLLVACSDNNNTSTKSSTLYWQIPKAPETNTLSSFNYTEETRYIDGRDVLYYVITNHTMLTGGTVFSMKMTYYARPTMVNVTHDNDRNVGVYTGGKLPIDMQIDKDLDGTADAEETKTMSVSMETKVNESELKIQYETRSANQGVFFSWDKRWNTKGEKPTDANDYFYVIWFVHYHRMGGSSQGYTYHLNIDKDSLGGGEIVGARKYTYNAADDKGITSQTSIGNKYEQSGYVISNLDATYANIAVSPDVLSAEWVGIPTDPTLKGTNYMTGYTTSNSYNYSQRYPDVGGWDYQTYAVLVKYPNTIITNAEKNGVDVVNDGVKLDFKASVTETWADGYTKTTKPFSPSDDRTVKVIRATGGGPGMNKQRTSINTASKSSIDVLGGWETFYGHGENFSVEYSMTNNAISNYIGRTPEGDLEFSGTRFTMTDGDYYLYSDDAKNNNYPYGKEVSKGTDSISGGDPLKLIEGVEYDYTSFYMSESHWNASYNEVLGIQRSSEPETNYTEFNPVEVWIRIQDEEEFKKFGEFKRETNGSYTFYFQDGGVQKTVKDNARVNFPAHTVGVQVRGDSPSYQTSTSLNFYVRYYSTERVQERVQYELNRGRRVFVGGAASGELYKGNTLAQSGALGTYWHRVSYGMNGVTHSTSMEKTYSSLVNDTKKSEQTVNVAVAFYYSSNYYGSNRRLIDMFISQSGIFYDLLPAGTYATDIKIGSRSPGPGISSGGQFTSGYTIEQIENWENSGQTMLKVTYDAPEGMPYWNTYWSGVCMTYKLHNPYINIIDRGVHAMNTFGLVDTSPDSVLIKMHTSAEALAKSSYRNKQYYQDIFEEANAQRFETAITEKDIVFNPVTVIEASFTNRVQTQSETGYETERTAYLADTYDFRLRYTAQNATRTTNIVMYDVLEKGGDDEIGDFDWIDVSSIESKKTYDKYNPATGDTCKPVVYYATVVPTAEELDVDNKNIWTTECPADKSTVKAIAIDCRKTDSGKDFVLDQGGTLVGYVHCVASDNEDWAGRVNQNDAYLSAAMFVGDDPGDNPKTEIIEDNSKVHLKKVTAVIEKTSDPVSGTKEQPAPIPNNEEGKSYDGLTYTLTVKNQTESGLPAARSIIVEDALPDGFTLNPKKEITLESETWGIKPGTKISANSNVVDVLSGQDLTITITNMPVQCELKITIPVTRAEKVIVPTDYQNTAKITKIGNLVTDITSETTYHRTIPEFTLHYEVIPDEKYGTPKTGEITVPKDVTNIPYGTEETLADALSSPDTTADLLDGSQKDVYGKWIFTGWCEEEACSGDPVTKVTITADKTVYGKWEFKPYEVEFKKIGTVKKEPLADAEFALYGSDYLEDGNVSEDAKPIEEGLKSDKDGLFALKKPLSVGTYYLVETKAPESYKQLEEPLVLTVDAEKGMTLENQPAGKDTENPMKLTFLVENEYLFGDLVIEKTLQKWEDESDATFVFSVEAVKNNETVFSDVASLTFSGPDTKNYTFTGVIPVGAKVTVTEVYSGTVYKAVGATEAKVTIEKPTGAENPAKASFTNTYNGGGNEGFGILNTFTKGDEGWVWTSDLPQKEE